MAKGGAARSTTQGKAWLPRAPAWEQKGRAFIARWGDWMRLCNCGPDAPSRAFVSFDFDHDELSKNLFVGQAKSDSPTPFTVADWSSKSSLPQSQWEKIISGKIARCHLMIVLVGRYMAWAGGVAKEIQMAKNANVPFFGVYVDGANSYSTLPTGLARNRTIAWTWPDIAKAIDQMMSEGKNKRSSWL